MPRKSKYLKRFWQRVGVSDGCWEWLHGKTKAGYGHIWTGSGMEYAHRISFEIHKGTIPDGYQIDHVCRNRGCVNPAHLDAVTQQENIRRQLAAREERKSCKHGHVLADVGYYLISGIKVCKACQSRRSAEYYIRKKQRK